MFGFDAHRQKMARIRKIPRALPGAHPVEALPSLERSGLRRPARRTCTSVVVSRHPLLKNHPPHGTKRHPPGIFGKSHRPPELSRKALWPLHGKWGNDRRKGGKNGVMRRSY